MKGAIYSKRVMIFVLSILGGVFFLQACGTAHWARSMMDMSCMGMMTGGNGDHEEGEKASLSMTHLCESSVYLDLREELSLTKDQVKQLKDLNLSCQKEAINKEAEIKSAELDYQSFLHDPASSQTELSSLEAKGKEMGNLYTQMQLIPVGFRKKALAILSEEQKTRLRYVPTSSSEGSPQGHPGYGGNHSGR